jgi:hypothetical protein
VSLHDYYGSGSIRTRTVHLSRPTRGGRHGEGGRRHAHVVRHIHTGIALSRRPLDLVLGGFLSLALRGSSSRIKGGLVLGPKVGHERRFLRQVDLLGLLLDGKGLGFVRRNPNGTGSIFRQDLMTKILKVSHFGRF